MHFTPAFKSSPHCAASPDGTLLATLFPTKITVRSLESLQTVHAISLPPDASGPVYAFQWSPDSSRLLVSLVDQVRVFSAKDSAYHAIIRIAHGGLKPTYVRFGASGYEVFICSQYGLKLTIADLRSSTSVEINQPKFHHPSSAPRGVALRPGTGHLAVITRVSGKDIISIHNPETRQVQRSWAPDTADAQAITWTPDGHWLVVPESSSQGHKVLFYTPDGQLFKTWSGPSGFQVDDKDYEMGAGVKVCELSSDSTRAAVGDHTRDVYILDMTAITSLLRLQHPSSITPRDTLQVWQEQSGSRTPSSHACFFVKATQTVDPPSPQPQTSTSEVKEGCLSAAFDTSANLLATRLEDSPSTVWIWDLASSELRAVLIFHNPVIHISWHPSIRELLLIRCEGQGYEEICFFWDPLAEGPKTVDFLAASPGGQIHGRSHCSWVKCSGNSGVILFSNGKNATLASLAEADQSPPWGHAMVEDSTSASDKLRTPAIFDVDQEIPLITPEDLSATDDTFAFKKT